MTDAQVEGELRERGLNDAEYASALALRNFAKTGLGIDLHVGQLAFGGRVLVRREGMSLAQWLTLVLTSGNRAGKTSIIAILIIYACLYKLGTPSPDENDARAADRWLRSEYHWYHFGIAQEVADLVFNDIVRILAGNHLGQKDGCPVTAQGPIADWDLKEYGDYRWIRFRPEWGGAQVHFRTTGEKALGQLGKDMQGLSFDEAGLERNLEFLINEVFDFRRLGTGGQLIMVSTPSEDLGTAFPDVWRMGDPENPLHKATWVSMRMSTRDNVGYGLDQDTFDIMVQDLDERTVRQNIDGEFLQAKAAYFNGTNVEAVFLPDLPERAIAIKNGVYLQGMDPAKMLDSAWSIVLRVEHNPADPDKPFLIGVRAEQRKGQKSTATLVGMAAEAFNAYDVARLGSICYTAIDATGFGGKMFREALDDEVPSLFNVEFGGTLQKKRKLLGDLRTLIDSGRLKLPSTGPWAQVRKQLLGYKLEDRGIEQDAVMALVCAVYLVRRAPANGVTAVAFDPDADGWR